MRVVWVVDIDTTIADNTHREHLLQKRCMVCGATVATKLHAACTVCYSDAVEVPQASWDAFLNPEAMVNDRPEPRAQKVIRKAQKLGIEVHYITGRSGAPDGDGPPPKGGDAREVTTKWLEDHFDFDPKKNSLLMRGQAGPASPYKEKQLKKLMEMKGYTKNDLLCFFEDDKHVIPMYSQYGIAFEAPSCWESMWSVKPSEPEPDIKK